VLQFLGIVSLEENNVKPNENLKFSLSAVSSLSAEISAELFVEVSSLMVTAIGVCYVFFGMCCGQRYLTKIRKDYDDGLAEQRKVSNDDLRLSKQMIS
jgi:hypothetical protein